MHFKPQTDLCVFSLFYTSIINKYSIKQWVTTHKKIKAVKSFTNYDTIQRRQPKKTGGKGNDKTKQTTVDISMIR
jgi:hypothetical protein